MPENEKKNGVKPQKLKRKCKNPRRDFWTNWRQFFNGLQITIQGSAGLGQKNFTRWTKKLVHSN